MKTYSIDVDFTISRTLTIKAENEGEAKERISNAIRNNPYNYIQVRNGYYVDHNIIDVNEDEDEDE